MARLRVGVIGTGRNRMHPSLQGYAMAYQHAAGYLALPDRCELVACADIVAENAHAFAAHCGIGADHVYGDAREMLTAEGLDLVSITLWPHLHAEYTLAAARAGVRAVFCEKPMAHTWGAAREMAAECARLGTQLYFNHQRRFGRPFRAAKELLDADAVGPLARVEFAAPNLYDYGSHSFDLCNYYAGQQPVQWVMAQIDYRALRLAFGQHNETQGHAIWRYADGTFGMAATGAGQALVACHNRLVGTQGEIEVGAHAPGAPVLRYRRYGEGDWRAVDCGDEGPHGPDYVERAVADVVGAVMEGRASELCARNALAATEIIFAAWESARRRSRVDLPLTISDNPLAAMVAEGALRPQPDA